MNIQTNPIENMKGNLGANATYFEELYTIAIQAEMVNTYQIRLSLSVFFSDLFSREIASSSFFIVGRLDDIYIFINSSL